MIIKQESFVCTPSPGIIVLESHEDFKELPYKIIHDHDLLLVNDPYKYINEGYHIIPTDDLDSLYLLIEESIENEEYEDILNEDYGLLQVLQEKVGSYYNKDYMYEILRTILSDRTEWSEINREKNKIERYESKIGKAGYNSGRYYLKNGRKELSIPGMVMAIRQEMKKDPSFRNTVIRDINLYTGNTANRNGDKAGMIIGSTMKDVNAIKKTVEMLGVEDAINTKHLTQQYRAFKDKNIRKEGILNLRNPMKNKAKTDKQTEYLANKEQLKNIETNKQNRQEYEKAVNSYDRNKARQIQNQMDHFMKTTPTSPEEEYHVLRTRDSFQNKIKPGVKYLNSKVDNKHLKSKQRLFYNYLKKNIGEPTDGNSNFDVFSPGYSSIKKLEDYRKNKKREIDRNKKGNVPDNEDIMFTLDPKKRKQLIIKKRDNEMDQAGYSQIDKNKAHNLQNILDQIEEEKEEKLEQLRDKYGWKDIHGDPEKTDEFIAAKNKIIDEYKAKIKDPMEKLDEIKSRYKKPKDNNTIPKEAPKPEESPKEQVLTIPEKKKRGFLNLTDKDKSHLKTVGKVAAVGAGVGPAYLLARKIASLKKVQNKYVRKMLLLPPAKRSLMQRAVDKIKVLIQKLAQRLQQIKRR